MKRYATIAAVAFTVAVVLGIILAFKQKSPDVLASPTIEPTLSVEPSSPTDHQVPAAPSAIVSTAANVGPPPQTLLHRIVQNDPSAFKLPLELVHAFLAKNGTNAESLLSAFNVTNDKEWLREAVRRFPDSPFVLATALAQDALPGQRRDLIDRLKLVSPDNPLAHYFSARDHLKNQQQDLALKELMDASSRSGFQDFTVERIQGLEDLYLSAGYSAAEAKALAMTGIQLPSIAPLRELGREMSALARQYAAAGDAASAENLARMGLTLAADITRGGANSLLSQIVGMVVAREFLGSLNPDRSYDFLAAPVAERLAQLQAQDKSIREASRFFDQWMQTASEAQLVSYFDRLKLYGEAVAIDWARTQFQPLPPSP